MSKIASSQPQGHLFDEMELFQNWLKRFAFIIITAVGLLITTHIYYLDIKTFFNVSISVSMIHLVRVALYSVFPT